MLPDEQQNLAGVPPVGDPKGGSVNPLQSPLQPMQYGSAVAEPAAAQQYPPQFPTSPMAGAVPQASIQSPALRQSVTSAAPSTADKHPADEAVWIEQVKNVVNQTMNDPYRRLQALQELQANYQREHLIRKADGGVSS